MLVILINKFFIKISYMKSALKIKRTLLVGLSVLFLIACSKSSDTPSGTQDGFKSGSFEEARIDKPDIINLENQITGREYNIHSILILRNNKLVYEKYFRGDDAVFPNPVGVIDHNRETLHDCRSVTKSIVSACVGIALEQGKIHSIDDLIFNYL